MEIYTIDGNFVPQGSGEPRSKGLHLTTVIRSIEKELGWDYKGKGFEDQDLTMEVGFWWEDMIAMVMAERLSAGRPGEVVKDGIIGSPDAVGPNPGLITAEGKVLVKPSSEVILEEYKFTWKSSRNKITDDWYYVTQGKSYCYMCGLTKCLWRVCYCMGDYRGSGPIYRQCFVEFTEEELYLNWQMILGHAKEKGMLK